MYHPFSSVFMTNKTTSGVEKHHTSTEPESNETAAFYTEQFTTSLLLYNFEVSQGTHSHSLKKCGFQFGMPFSLFVCVHAHLKIS